VWQALSVPHLFLAIHLIKPPPHIRPSSGNGSLQATPNPQQQGQRTIVWVMKNRKTSAPTQLSSPLTANAHPPVWQDRFYNRVKGAVKGIRKKNDGNERSPSAEKLGPGARSPYLQRRKIHCKLRADLPIIVPMCLIIHLSLSFSAPAHSPQMRARSVTETALAEQASFRMPASCGRSQSDHVVSDVSVWKLPIYSYIRRASRAPALTNSLNSPHTRPSPPTSSLSPSLSPPPLQQPGRASAAPPLKPPPPSSVSLARLGYQLPEDAAGAPVPPPRRRPPVGKAASVQDVLGSAAAAERLPVRRAHSSGEANDGLSPSHSLSPAGSQGMLSPLNSPRSPHSSNPFAPDLPSPDVQRRGKTLRRNSSAPTLARLLPHLLEVQHEATAEEASKDVEVEGQATVRRNTGGKGWVAVWESAEQDGSPDCSVLAEAAAETHGVADSKTTRKRAPSKAAASTNGVAHAQEAEKRILPPVKPKSSTVTPPSAANAGKAKKKVPPPRPPRPTLSSPDQPPPG
jgi:hypothetical protein